MSLVKTFKEQLPRLIGRNFFISLASGSFGIRVIMEKISLNTSKEPAQKSAAKAIKSFLITS
jgi:hypothetical protein